MRHQTFRTVIAAGCLLAALSHATAEIEDDIREITSNLTNRIKSAIPVGKAPDVKIKPVEPYKPIIGNWYDRNASIVNLNVDPSKQQQNYQWDGQIIGRITETGEYRFKANNGCEITGFATPFASHSMWYITTETTHCPFEYMNVPMAGRIFKDGNMLRLTLDDPPFAMGRKQVFTMRAVMKMY